MQALPVWHEGKLESMVLGVLERELNANELRSSAIARFTPIHSFLFNATGKLVFANNKAEAKLRARGVPCLPQLAHCHVGH